MTTPKLRVIPGWRGTLLRQLRLGRNMATAVSIARVSTAQIRREQDRDSKFAEELEEAKNTPIKPMRW